MERISKMALAMGLLAGCETGFAGGPTSTINPERNFSEIVINSTLDVGTLQALAAQPVIDPQVRNRIIEARLAEIDILYFEYETALSADLRRGSFSTNVLSLVIGAAGAQASGGTSQQLSALGGLVTGVSTAFQKEVLLEQSLQAFISQMRASRNQVKTRILTNMTRPGESYSLQAALADLADYEQAGTIISAVAGVTEITQDREAETTAKLSTTEAATAEQRADVDRRPLNATVTSRAINDFILNGGPEDEQTARFQSASACFESASSEKPSSFVNFLANPSLFVGLDGEISSCLNLGG